MTWPFTTIRRLREDVERIGQVLNAEIARNMEMDRKLAESRAERDKLKDANDLKTLTIEGLYQLAALNGFDLKSPFSVTEIIQERDAALAREAALLKCKDGMLFCALSDIAAAGEASKNGTARKMARMAREAAQ